MLAGVGITAITDVGQRLSPAFLNNNRSIRMALQIIDDISVINALSNFADGDSQKKRDELLNLQQDVGKRLAAVKDELGTSESARALDDSASEWETYREGTLRMMSISDREERGEYFEESVLPSAFQMRQSLQSVILLQLEATDKELIRSRNKLARSRILLLFLSALSLILCVGLLSYLGKLLIHPIRELVAMIDGLSSDSIEAVPLRRRGDEVGMVVSAVQRFLDRIRIQRSTDRQMIRVLARRSEHALNSIPDAIIVYGANGEVEYRNRAAEAFTTGGESLELSTIRWPKVRDIVEECLATGKPISGGALADSLQCFTNGVECFFLPSAYPVEDDDGAITEVTLLLNDVTFLKQLDEMKTDLVAVVSHQLKTPLTSIRMSLGMLARSRGAALPERDKLLIDTAREETERLQTTIQNLLDMARFRSGANLMQLEETNLALWLSEVADSHKRWYNERDIVLLAEIAEDTPRVVIDRIRLNVVMENLLSNCLAYCRPGDTVRIAAGASHASADSVLVSVIDTGPGIAAEERELIFEKFYRAGSRATPGTGLGLAIAREILRSHGGTIVCESELGKGTAFHITLNAMAPPEVTAPE